MLPVAYERHSAEWLKACHPTGSPALLAYFGLLLGTGSPAGLLGNPLQPIPTRIQSTNRLTSAHQDVTNQLLVLAAQLKTLAMSLSERNRTTGDYPFSNPHQSGEALPVADPYVYPQKIITSNLLSIDYNHINPLLY